jgi:hypothetical protein
MAINWQELFTNVSATLTSGAVVLAPAAWLTKTLLSDHLVRQAEAFKIKLRADFATANERLKNSLQMVALEHQVRFSKLHEKRAQVIEKVYQRLVELEKGYGRFVLVDGFETDTQKQQDARIKINVKMYNTALFIEKHRIYLPAEVCTSLKAFLDIMWHHAISVVLYGSISNPNPQTLTERQQAFRDAYEALRNEIPAARAALENEFRKLLGSVDERGSLG